MTLSPAARGILQIETTSFNYPNGGESPTQGGNVQLASAAAALLLLLSGCQAFEVEPAGAPVAILNIMIGVAGKYADDTGRLPRKHPPFLRLWCFKVSAGGRVTWDRPPGAPGGTARRRHSSAPHLRLRLGKDVVYFALVFRF